MDERKKMRREEEKNYCTDKSKGDSGVSVKTRKKLYPRTASTVDGRVHIRFSCRRGERIHLK
jgi:hypothetical protein